MSAKTDTRQLILDLVDDETVPAIVRASAIVQAQFLGDAELADRLAVRADSADPLIRWAVARMLQGAPEAVVSRHAPPLLEDPVKAVRIDAANALAPVALELIPVHSQQILRTVLNESIEAELVNRERAEAQVNIGILERKLRHPEEAIRAYRTAMALNPYFAPAYVNLADLYREQDRERSGESVLRSALSLLPDQPVLHYALGLSLVRQGRMEQARENLRQAASAGDAEPRMTLAYALILDRQGETEAAIECLEDALGRFGDDPDLLAALINLYLRTHRPQAAEALIQRLGHQPGNTLH